MDFYEADLIKTQTILKELEENPERRLKSFQIYLKKKAELRKEQIEAVHKGKLLMDIDPHMPTFFRAMGFVPYDGNAASNPRHGAISPSMSHAAYKEKAQALGLSTDCCCDMTYVLPAMVVSGDIPLEPLIMGTNHECTAFLGQKVYIAHKFRNDRYFFDIPFFESESALEYLVNQLREFMEYAESKYPGRIKYDEKKLIALQARDKETAKYNLEIYEMLKTKPSPIAGDDINHPTGEWDTKDPEYLKARRDEVAERVKNGIAAVPGEKLRVCWVGSKIRFMDPFKIMAKRQAAVVFWYSGNVSTGYSAPQPRYTYYGGRTLTPLEEVAAGALSHTLGGTGAHYTDNLLRVCRDLKIDAVVHFQQLGASCIRGYKGIIAQRFEKELGIPVLQLEGKRTDPTYVNEETLSSKLDEFIQLCLAKKGL